MFSFLTSSLLPGFIIFTFLSRKIIAKPAHNVEPYLKVDFFPVGEGDAMMIECPDVKTGSTALTLVNAGSVSLKGIIAEEYFTYIENKLRKPGLFIKNIVITNPAEHFYNYIEPLLFVRKDSVKDIKFYIAGERQSYSILEDVFDLNENVFEFTRKNETGERVNSCGHFAADNETFYNCIKRNSKGPLPKSDPVITLCDNFEITVMAANYGLSNSSSHRPTAEDAAHNNSGDSLVLKITPTGKPSPSILLGDFENTGKKVKKKDDYYYTYIKDAHDYYTRSEQFPLSLANGLASTLIKIPQNGAATDATVEKEFYRDYVQPTYAVVSASITSAAGNPKCEVLQAINSYLSLFSRKKKVYQCHPLKSKFPVDVKILSNGSDNLYETSTIVIKNFPHGKVQYNLISLIMTKDEIRKPTSRVQYVAKGYD